MKTIDCFPNTPPRSPRFEHTSSHHYGEGYAHHYWSGVDKSTFNAGRDLKEWHALRALAATGLVRLRDGQGPPSTIS